MRARVVVQVVAILVGAGCTFLAGWKYSDASSAWQEAIRVEVDRAGVRQDDVRQVYANEGPFAFRVAVLQIRADVLAALEGTNATAATEVAIAENAAFAFRQAAGPETLLGRRSYDLPGGGSNLAHRLADVAAERERPVPDPDVPDRKGDDLAELARWISVITVLATGLAVFAASMRGSGRSPGLQLFPQPGTANGQQRRFAFLALAVWAAGILLPLLQMAFSSHEQHYQAESARHVVQARSAESISSTRREFGNTGRLIAREGSVVATGREIDANYADAQTVAAARALAGAEEAAATRSEAVALAMARAPLPEDGVEAGLAAALTSQRHDWNVLTARSVWETRTADGAGIASNSMLAAIALVVLAQARMQAIAERQRLAQAERPPRPRDRSGRTVGLICLGLVIAIVLWLSRRRA